MSLRAGESDVVVDRIEHGGFDVLLILRLDLRVRRMGRRSWHFWWVRRGAVGRFSERLGC